MTLINFIIIAFSSFCLSQFVANDAWSGPFNLLHKFRHLIGARYNETSQLVGNNVVAEALLCWVCSPIWISVLFTATYLLWPPILYAYVPLAVGGMVLMSNRF